MKMDVTDYVLGGGALGCGWLAWKIFEGTAFPDIDALWAIPLAIIALILGGLYIHRKGKLGEQRTKKLKDFAEQMGMEFSVEDEWDIGESLSAFDLFWEADITNVLSGDSEQLGYGEEFEVTVLDCSYVESASFLDDPLGFGGENSTKTIVQTVICFHSPQLNLPDFSMRPEEWHHKLRSKLGYQDIDFESHPTAVEFSKKYLLRGEDEQKIRALFTDTALTFFAAHPDEVCVEGSDDQLIWYQPGKIIEPEDIPAFMKEGFEVFRLFTQEQN
jgi:hypothetical protein